MKQISSMFLRNVTCIDHAFVDNRGFIEGGSYHQEIIVTGEVDEHEQVVVDFSAVKKQIKAIIDAKETGFDHKLWIIKGWSDCQVNNLENGYVQVVTPHHILVAPRNALKIVEGFQGYQMNPFDAVETQMTKEVEAGLNEANGVDCIKVQIKLTKQVFGEDAVKFTYFHGLKNSSSWGCNNIAHGHTSFVEVYDDLGQRIKEVEKIIAHYLDGAMLIFKENLETPNKISYETPRGKFSLSFTEDVKTIVMEQETTIENIVEHVCERMKPVLDFYAVSKVFISEGLQKGALKQIAHK